MDNQELRARLGGRIDTLRGLYDDGAAVQVSLDPQEFLALTAEHCPCKLVEIREAMLQAELMPTHVLIGLADATELLEAPDDDED